MGLVNIRRPGILEGLNMQSLKRWTKHTSDNIARINEKYELIELDLTQATEELFDNPRGEAVPIGFQPIGTFLEDGAPGLGLSSWQLDVTRTDGQLSLIPQFQHEAGQQMGPISRVRTNATALTSTVAANVCTTTSITLTAGVWLVRGDIGFIPAAGTTLTIYTAAISKTSATLPTGDVRAVPTAGESRTQMGFNGVASDGNITIVPASAFRVSVADGATLQLFLVASATFGVSTMSAFGSLEATLVGPPEDYAATVRGYLIYE